MKKESISLVALSILWLFGLTSCKEKQSNYDASGTFEADEVIVSAEQTGRILQLQIEEGQTLQSNAIIGQIDVSALEVQKEQSKAAVGAIREKVGDAGPQVEILESQLATQNAQIQTLNEQLSVLSKEVTRTQNLVKVDAATPKQLDDLLGQQSILNKQIKAANEQIGVLQAQISAAKRNVSLQNKSILSEVNPAGKRIDILNDQISRGQIKNGIAGTVLTKYAVAGEFTAVGKPLYKIADLSTVTLRTYITGNQLPQVKLNQKVKVLTDDGNGGYKETEGTITWISDKAEFTPKTIQTKAERANMVYAVKVKVKNDGSYKIGMYGEIKFQ